LHQWEYRYVHYAPMGARDLVQLDGAEELRSFISALLGQVLADEKWKIKNRGK